MIVFILYAITTQSTLKHEGVSWNKKRNLWQAEFYFKGEKQQSYFDNEFDASKKLDQRCVKMEIPPQNPGIYEIRNEQKREKISQYKGVTWHKTSGKWYVQLKLKGEKIKYGGVFKDELDAAKRVNQLCEKLGIRTKNSSISAIPNHQYQKREKISQYKGVTWHKPSGKWLVQLNLKGKTQRYGGRFDDELEAAKKVNQLCEELGIPHAITDEQFQKKEKTSQYKGVYWHTQSGKWYAQLKLKGEERKYGGTFEDELNAAKRVNQLCEEMEIPPYNPTISGRPDEQYQ